MPSPSRKKGDIAEDIVEKLLRKQGYHILERNYLRKWGEIDIIVENKGIIHFIEVKSALAYPLDEHVSCETINAHYIDNTDFYIRPEENMTNGKKRNLRLTIEKYLLDHKNMEDFEIQIDVYSVLLDYSLKKATIQGIKNVVLD